MDRNLSSALGRPCCIQDEEYVNAACTFASLYLQNSSYDLDFPVECDDEYWYTDDPSLAFKQPPGKPSKVSFFRHFIKLCQIHGRALRTIVRLSEAWYDANLTHVIVLC